MSLTTKQLHKNAERDRIRFMMKRDGVTETLVWAERLYNTYYALLEDYRWRWIREGLLASIEELRDFRERAGILDKRRYEDEE